MSECMIDIPCYPLPRYAMIEGLVIKAMSAPYIVWPNVSSLLVIDRTPRVALPFVGLNPAN